VQSDDLVAEDVVAGLDAAGDSDSAAVVVADQVVGGPGAGNGAVVDETTLVDLEELQSCLVHGGAVAIAVGQVGDDRAVVTLGPLSPLQLDATTGLDGSRDGTRLGTLVTDDVRRGIRRTINVAQVGGSVGPGNGLGRVALVRILSNQISTIIGTVNNGARHVTVASDQSGRAEDNTGNLGERHCFSRLVRNERTAFLSWIREGKEG
jgi:hypothetical protein